jgi:hypothetical protein
LQRRLLGSQTLEGSCFQHAVPGTRLQTKTSLSRISMIAP